MSEKGPKFDLTTSAEFLEVKEKRESYWLKDLWKSKIVVMGLVFLFLMVFGAVFAQQLATHDPITTDLRARLSPPIGFEGYSEGHFLGTDAIGRDVWSRLVYGARISLMVGFVAVVIAGILGTTLGLISGFFGGWVDDIIMRLADVQLAFPFILLMLAVLAVVGPGLWNLIIVLGVTGWVSYSRVVRGTVMSLREKEFVEAARCIGASNFRIIVRHILPNIVGPVVVIASFSVASTIIAEASLSFLGMGVDLDTATWGKMLSEGREYVRDGWWLTTIPGLAIALTVMGINLVGDWLRDEIDPKTMHES
ncbi:MAG: ABC transporter permease [Anaerolineaceae bacterium]|nr:ABC transporter permease [Anaerolineaceae bacterium]